jgi:RND superfamily putative drug exporter
VNDVVSHDLRHAEVLSVPITLVILVLAFGALVAAVVPLLLGLTAVAAALGALGLVSQLQPTSDTTATVIVLIGLAVGVDYSLFYIRREREERRAGRSPDAALDVAAATVGRAVLVSGLTVMVALAGLLFTGLAVFSSMALATMLVALVAVIGSLTVLPATLSLLGDRIDAGRVPGLRRRAGRSGAWARLAGAVTRRPRAALVTALCLLAALAVPALGMHTADPEGTDLPRDLKVVQAQRAIEAAFPGAPDTADLVVTGSGLDHARGRLAALGDRARAVTGGHGHVGVTVSRDASTAVVSVPMPARGAQGSAATVGRLRDQVAPTAARIGPGARAMVTGSAASDADFTAKLSSGTPVVIAFVLGLAFVLLCAAFRSPALAASVIGLNLLSVGAAYGLLALTFQHTWAEGVLGFTSNGTIVNWLPLFVFVILFGLSMDYTVLVLERIREARRAGRPARRAAADGVAATAGTVTSAAVVMVAVFAIFGTLRLLEMKQFGVGLAAAVILDATIVRGVALPAVVALLGERRWRVPRRRERPARTLVAEAGR